MQKTAPTQGQAEVAEGLLFAGRTTGYEIGVEATASVLLSKSERRAVLDRLTEKKNGFLSAVAKAVLPEKKKKEILAAELRGELLGESRVAEVADL